ncbi:MAG: hypothetical protein IJH38_03740 [Clostridia bacterium]|nr:hypothetical protein [Clostridia bacterium]
MKSMLCRVISACLMLVLVISVWPAMAEEKVALSVNELLWVGQGYVDVYVDDPYDDAEFISVKSSNSKVLRVKHVKGELSFSVKPLKQGKSTIQFVYKRNGRKFIVKKTIRVKKYPNAIASLKINGETILLKDHKCSYTVSKFRKTSATVKVKPAKGWKVKGMYADLEYIGYKEIKNGKAFKLHKKGRGEVWFDLINEQNQVFTYTIEINRD